MSDPLEKTYELGRLQGIKDCEAMHHRIRADERARVLREVAKMLREADGQWVAALLVDSSLASNISERLHRRVLEMRAAAPPAPGARNEE